MYCGAGCTRHHHSFSHEDRLNTWWRHRNHGYAKLARARRYRYADFRTISNTDSRAPFIVSYDCPRDDPYRDVGTGLRVQRTDADRRQVLIGPRCRVSRSKNLRATKPVDIPVEQPAKFTLHINLKIAKVQYLTVPPTLLACADEVIK